MNHTLYAREEYRPDPLNRKSRRVVTAYYRNKGDVLPIGMDPWLSRCRAGDSQVTLNNVQYRLVWLKSEVEPVDTGRVGSPY